MKLKTGHNYDGILGFVVHKDKHSVLNPEKRFRIIRSLRQKVELRHECIRHLLSVYYMQNTGLSARDAYRKVKHSFSQGSHIRMGETTHVEVSGANQMKKSRGLGIQQ